MCNFLFLVHSGFLRSPLTNSLWHQHYVHTDNRRSVIIIGLFTNFISSNAFLFIPLAACIVWVALLSQAFCQIFYSPITMRCFCCQCGRHFFFRLTHTQNECAWVNENAHCTPGHICCSEQRADTNRHRLRTNNLIKIESISTNTRRKNKQTSLFSPPRARIF